MIYGNLIGLGRVSGEYSEHCLHASLSFRTRFTGDLYFPLDCIVSLCDLASLLSLLVSSCKSSCFYSGDQWKWHLISLMFSHYILPIGVSCVS